MSPALVAYLNAGRELAQAVEELIAEAERPVSLGRKLDTSRLSNAVWLTERAQLELSVGGMSDHRTLATYRRIDGLRKLVSAWRQSGSRRNPDLTDLAGPCRIVNRAWRDARQIIETGAEGLSATHANRGAPEAPGEGDEGPDDVPSAPAGERSCTANPDKVRTHHNPRGEPSNGHVRK